MHLAKAIIYMIHIASAKLQTRNISNLISTDRGPGECYSGSQVF